METKQMEWVSQDGQGSMSMGSYATEAEAKAAQPACLAEMLAGCSSEDERAGIRAGCFVITD